MIRFGDLELHAISAKGGDEGWSEHWEIRRRKRCIGYAISLQGALRAAMSQSMLEAEIGRRGIRTIEEALAELLRRIGPGGPAKATDSGQETTSPRKGLGGQA